MNHLSEEKLILRFNNGKLEKATDPVIREISFTLIVNDQRLVSIACLPDKLPALAMGFLLSEGIVFSLDEIRMIHFDQVNFTIKCQLDIPENRIEHFHQTGEKTSGCGASLSASISGEKNEFEKIVWNFDSILSIMHDFQKQSSLFRDTGGVHSAGLIINYKLAFSAEDIGRHNAVDKVAGWAFQNNIDLANSFLICSGRISSEIVKKCVRLHIPVIISQSATTSEAIRLASKFKVYILGFTRGKRINIYTGIDNI